MFRNYYIVETTKAVVSGLRLHEGASRKHLAANEIFSFANVTPYDSFAVWLHVARDRFR